MSALVKAPGDVRLVEDGLPPREDKKNGGRSRTVFLAKAEATVIGPPKWEKPLRTDENGRVTVPAPWAGRYLVEAVHTEEVPGEAAGERFDRLRRVFTLTFVQADGLPWTAPRAPEPPAGTME